MIRYSKIDTGMKREFVLLQGLGCKWRQCTFCDYYLDTSKDPFIVNKPVLEEVTGCYGVLDIINSGSCPELDSQTIDLIKEVVKSKGIKELWFEAHWIYRNELEKFAEQFHIPVHFRLGIESFNPDLRLKWKKGIGRDATAEEIKKYFDGVCLLVGVEGQTIEDIIESIEIAEANFQYYSVNLFCPNSGSVKKDEEVSRKFIEEIVPMLKKSPKAEILIDNTDLGVG